MPLPSFFARMCFNWIPFDYQIKALDDMSKRIIINFGRQTGKSETCAIKGLHHAYMNDNSTVLIVSPTQRQSGILFRRMKYFLTKSKIEVPQLKIINSIKRETQLVLEFENGSMIYSLPASDDASNLRGFTSNLLIIDEAARIADEVFNAISPMLAATDGQMILISTPHGIQNFFAKAYNNHEKMGFSRHFAKSCMSPLIKPEFLESEKTRMPINQYMEEYEAQFIDESDSLFTFEEVEGAILKDAVKLESPRTGFIYMLGYDPARMGEDLAVGIIIEDRGEKWNENDKKKHRRFQAVKIVEFKKKNLKEQSDIIKILDSIWHFSKILIDITGMGCGLSDDLIDKNLHIDPITFSIKSKMEIYNNLKMFLSNNSIGIPNNIFLKKSLLEMKYEYQKGTGMMRVYHPSASGGDDYACALALACWGTKSNVPQIIFGTASGMFK